MFVDIGADTYNIDPSLIEDALTPRTRAILCVHQMGLPCDVRSIVRIAHRHGLSVVEDAACAVGSEILGDGGWEKIGAPHGEVACFSLHPRKLLSTGDGGMITTASAEHDAACRRTRQHGMTISDLRRHRASTVAFEAYAGVGYNYRLTDIQAAIGRVQLARMPDGVARRRRLAARYGALLRAYPEFTVPREPSWARSNWQSYCVGLPDEADQRGVMQAMLDAGVATRRGIMCAHREPAYVDAKPRHPLPRSEKAQDRTILIPLFNEMTEDDQDYVVETLVHAYRERR